jgi:phosphopantetheinyl transferase
MPQIYFENLKSFCNAEIFFWHIKEGCNELSEYIADNGTLLSEAKRRFKSESRQREWLATRALLHSTQYKGETILYNDNGKPCLAGNNRHISISHTNEYVAIAVSDYPIGIDIERTDRNAYAVAKSFLTEQEIDILTQENNPSKQALCLWSAKEAAFKLASENIAILKEIGITKNADNYIVAYPDGTTAVCDVCLLEDIVVACCRECY